MPNALYYGDNLEILREHTAYASVDLIYLGPPFNSHATWRIDWRPGANLEELSGRGRAR